MSIHVSQCPYIFSSLYLSYQPLSKNALGFIISNKKKKRFYKFLISIYCSIKFHIELPFIVKLHIYYFRKDTKLMTKSIIVELKVVIFLLINREFCHTWPPSTTDCLSLV